MELVKSKIYGVKRVNGECVLYRKIRPKVKREPKPELSVRPKPKRVKAKPKPVKAKREIPKNLLVDFKPKPKIGQQPIEIIIKQLPMVSNQQPITTTKKIVTTQQLKDEDIERVQEGIKALKEERVQEGVKILKEEPIKTNPKGKKEIPKSPESYSSKDISPLPPLKVKRDDAFRDESRSSRNKDELIASLLEAGELANLKIKVTALENTLRLTKAFIKRKETALEKVQKQYDEGKDVGERLSDINREIEDAQTKLAEVEKAILSANTTLLASQKGTGIEEEYKKKRDDIIAKIPREIRENLKGNPDYEDYLVQEAILYRNAEAKQQLKQLLLVKDELKALDIETELTGKHNIPKDLVDIIKDYERTNVSEEKEDAREEKQEGGAHVPSNNPALDYSRASLGDLLTEKRLLEREIGFQNFFRSNAYDTGSQEYDPIIAERNIRSLPLINEAIRQRRAVLSQLGGPDIGRLIASFEQQGNGVGSSRQRITPEPPQFGPAENSFVNSRRTTCAGNQLDDDTDMYIDPITFERIPYTHLFKSTEGNCFDKRNLLNQETNPLNRRFWTDEEYYRIRGVRRPRLTVQEIAQMGQDQAEDDRVVPGIYDREDVMDGNGLDTGLTNIEISKLMASVPDFIGVIPSDKVDTLDIDDKKKPSFIMNLDKTGQPGSHWVCCYIDPIDDKEINYYDPLGQPASEDFMTRIQTLISKKLKPKHLLKFKWNNVKNQTTSMNCGFHTIVFLKNRYKGMSFKECTGFKEPKILDNHKEKENNIDKFKKQVVEFKLI